MIRRSLHATLALVLAVGAIATFSMAPAQAQNPPGYEGVCNLTVSAGNVSTAGGTLTVSGTSFPASTNIPIILDKATSNTTVGTAHVNAAGSFSDTATLPAGLSPTTHTISVFCATGNFDASFTIGILGIDFTKGAFNDPANINCSGSVHSTTTGYSPGTTLHQTLEPGGKVLADLTVDANGATSSSYTITSATTPAGSYSLVSAGTGADGNPLTQQAPLTVTANACTATGPLARTGSDSKPEVIIGLGAIGIGAALVLATRRRRTRTPA